MRLVWLQMKRQKGLRRCSSSTCATKGKENGSKGPETEKTHRHTKSKAKSSERCTPPAVAHSPNPRPRAACHPGCPRRSQSNEPLAAGNEKETVSRSQRRQDPPS